MIYIGDKKLRRCYLGDKEIAKVYRGNTLLWDKYYSDIPDEPAPELPEGYTPVRYIEIDNDTVFYSNIGMYMSYTRIIMDIMPLEEFNQYRCLFYSQYDSNTVVRNVGALYGDRCILSYSSNGAPIYAGNNAFAISDVAIGERILVDLNCVALTLQIKDNIINLYKNQYSDYTGGIYIGGRPWASTWNFATNSMHMRLYNFKLYRQGILVGELVPCVNSSGTPGLYNINPGIVTTFITNSEGTLKAGPTYN